MTSEQASYYQRRYWSQLSEKEKAERLASFIEAGQKHNKKSKKTKIENVMADILDELEFDYDRNVQVGRYNVDFLIDAVYIVECFGDFWHCNPSVYEAAFFNKSLKMTAQEKWAKDERRKKTLESKGFAFISFWGAEIREERESIKGRLKNFLPRK